MIIISYRRSLFLRLIIESNLKLLQDFCLFIKTAMIFKSSYSSSSDYARLEPSQLYIFYCLRALSASFFVNCPLFSAASMALSNSSLEE